MNWRDMAISAIHNNDIGELWRAIAHLETYSSLDFLLPEVILYSGYGDEGYLPVVPNKNLLDIAGYIIDSVDDIEGLLYQSIDANDIGTFSFIINRYDIDPIPIRDYAEDNNRYDILDIIDDIYPDLDEDVPMSY